MNRKSVKLVATDMDGTLLNSNKQLSPDFFTIFDALKKRGILFAAASGRQFYNLQNQFAPVKHEMAFIAENGSYVTYKNEELHVQAMEVPTVHSLIEIAREIPQAYIIVCGKKQAYIENTDDVFMEHVTMYYDRREVVPDLLEVTDDDFLKIAICDLAGSATNSYPYFKSLKQELQVKVSGNSWLDLSHRLANKGEAIKVLQSRLSIGYGETMVFGDYLNDLEMMQEAYFSYAVENAHPDVLKAARFTTHSNDEDGVLSILRQL